MSNNKTLFVTGNTSVAKGKSLALKPRERWDVAGRRQWKRDKLPARIYLRSHGWKFSWFWNLRWGNSCNISPRVRVPGYERSTDEWIVSMMFVTQNHNFSSETNASSNSVSPQDDVAAASWLPAEVIHRSDSKTFGKWLISSLKHVNIGFPLEQTSTETLNPLCRLAYKGKTFKLNWSMSCWWNNEVTVMFY